ncbi:MAG: hypothetical protein IPM79_20855 [Polyangiaceae bacterium]|nr:hypothetical protein [Polyangiaceae bacterium]
MTLAIYDPVVYEYGSSSLVCRAGPDDVAFLNELQAAYAFNALYFDPVRMPTGTLEALVQDGRTGARRTRDLTKVRGALDTSSPSPACGKLVRLRG